MNDFIADPTREGRYFAGTDAGVFVSYDYGLNWESLNMGLGNVPITVMKIHDTEEVLVIGTYGLSAYRLNLKDLAVDVPQIDRPSSSLVLNTVYPQPFQSRSSDVLWIEVSSGMDAPAEVHVYDINGRMISNVLEMRLKAGINKIFLNQFLQSESNLKPGNYLVSITSCSKRVVGKVLVL